MSVSIERRVVVKGGGCKLTPWILPSVSVLDGKEFTQLTKRDSGFCRFVSGSPSGSRGMSFLDELRRKRSAATLAACSQPASNEQLFEATPTAAARKKLKQAAIAQQERGEMPDLVVLDLPRIIGQDGVEVGPIKLAVRSSLDISSNVWVELTSEALTYIRAAMLASEPLAPMQRGATDAGVRWRNDRGRFVATRFSQRLNREVMRSFKPEDDTQESKEAAKEDAKAWVAAGSDEEEDKEPEEREG